MQQQQQNKLMNNTKTPTEVTEYLVAYFETYNALPTPVIECQSSGTAYTCFGSNLKGKIVKAGGIKELLTTFTGRGQVKKTAPKSKKEIVITAQELEDSRMTVPELVEAKIEKRSRPSRSKAAIAERAAQKQASETVAA